VVFNQLKALSANCSLILFGSAAASCRAISLADAPSASASGTIARFLISLNRQRRSGPEITFHSAHHTILGSDGGALSRSGLGGALTRSRTWKHFSPQYLFRKGANPATFAATRYRKTFK